MSKGTFLHFEALRYSLANDETGSHGVKTLGH